MLVFTNMYPCRERPFYGSFVRDEVEALRRAGCSVDVLFVNGLAAKTNYLCAPFRLHRALSRGRYQLIHSHHSYCSFFALFPRRLPLVWTCHEGELTSPPGSGGGEGVVKRLAYWGGFKRWIAKKVDALILVAEHMRRPLGREDAFLVPCGIDLDLFSPRPKGQARKELGLDDGVRYVLFPSTPERVEKRFSLADEAVTRARRMIPEQVEFLFLADVPHERVPLYMNAADVMLMTSRFEASPVTVREALACNLPVVSTDVGDVDEVLAGIEGCHVVDDNPEVMALLLADLLREPRKVAGRGRAEKYSLARVAERVMEIYLQVLEGKRRRG